MRIKQQQEAEEEERRKKVNACYIYIPSYTVAQFIPNKQIFIIPTINVVVVIISLL